MSKQGKREEERVANIARAYDTQAVAEGYFGGYPPRSIYDRIRNQEFQAVFAHLERAEEHPRALDIGCCSGRYTQALVQRGWETTGLDTGLVPLLYAAERIPQARLVRASVTHLPFRAKLFDLVLCIELFHHLDDQVLGEAMQQISRVTRPGGLLAFDVKNRWNPVLWYIYRTRDRVSFTLKSRPLSRMERLARKNGFRILRRRPLFLPCSLLAPIVILFARQERTD